VPTDIERLYREHRTGLVRLVERELHDHEDAEDVVQTAFIDAQRALERGTVPRNPGAWLAAIALNAGRRLRRRRLNAEPFEEYAVQAPRTPEIHAALAGLPQEQREAVVYRDVLGLSYGETAEQMGTSVNAVTMLLHRGRKRLRQTLGIAAGGFGLWRWLKHAGMPQVAVAKGAAALVVGAGLASTGVVAARAVAPTETVDVAAAALPTRAAAVLAPDTARRHSNSAGSSGVSRASAPKHGSKRDATTESARSSTAEVAPPPSPSSSTLRVSTVSLPTLPIPTAPVTVAAAVTLSTPITTVSVTTPAVTTPPGTTATVTTPITTVTLPIP
jgi:RNA polymerase sigma-70 factor (ECF subfamily)